MGVEGTLINGTFHDHSSRRITIDDEEHAGISEISYSDNLEPGKVRGTRAQPLGHTRGNYESEASFTMNKRRFYQMIAKFGPNGDGNGFKEHVFSISVSHTDDDGKGFITDTIVGCRITQHEDSSSEGGDPINVQVTIAPLYILWNGLNPLVNMVL